MHCSFAVVNSASGEMQTGLTVLLHVERVARYDWSSGNFTDSGGCIVHHGSTHMLMTMLNSTFQSQSTLYTYVVLLYWRLWMKSIPRLMFTYILCSSTAEVKTLEVTAEEDECKLIPGNWKVSIPDELGFWRFAAIAHGSQESICSCYNVTSCPASSEPTELATLNHCVGQTHYVFAVDHVSWCS